MRLSPAVKGLVFCSVALLAAIACRVLIPVYQREHDQPISRESREQVKMIMVAINEFVERNPEHRFPTNFTEVPSLFISGTTNLNPVCSRFVYLPPPPHASKRDLFGRVVVVEKLGHYKYNDGGNCGKAGELGGGWLSTDDYKTLAEKNGLSLQQLSEPEK